MATRKTTAKQTTKIEAINPEPESVKVKESEALIFKANRPLKPGEFLTLSNMLRKEQEASGLKIVLIPFTVDKE